MQEQTAAASTDSPSIWFGTFVPPIFPSLGGNARTEVCVVGAGIAGLSTAYMLMKAGKKVTVLERGSLGCGESGRTAAHLTAAMDDRIHILEQIHGANGARQIVQSHRSAIDDVEAIVLAENIDCDFKRVDGYLVLAANDSEHSLDTELAAAERAKLPGVSKVPSVPRSEFDFGPALRFPDQAQFHVLKYLAGLASAIVLGGGRIYTDSDVVRVEGGTPCKVVTDNSHTITADAVCVCTNEPIGDAAHPSQQSFRSFAIAATVPRDSVEAGLYWDTADPYHYVRIHPLETPKAKGRKKVAPLDALIIGGEDQPASAPAASTTDSVAEQSWQRLEAWMRERWPQAGAVVHRWSGRVFEPSDHVAFIGRHRAAGENVYIATGDSGQGMTHGMIAGNLLSDLICGRSNELQSIYDPNRS